MPGFIRGDSSCPRLNHEQFTTARNAAWRWFTDYLCQPHSEVGRAGAVCPFVEPSMRAGSLRMQVRELGPELTHENLVELFWESADHFQNAEWQHSNKTLHALAVVIADLPEDRLEMLDQMHATVKSAAVARGLMLGQFHPRCPEPAARNPAFPVARSPVPMIAIRNMAFHDILFLHDNPEWLRHYLARFGRRYQPDLSVDPLFLELFYDAIERHGLG
jgi:heptaprenyl diphosphate synthase